MSKVASKKNLQDAIYENNLRLKRWIKNLFPNKTYLDKIGEDSSGLTYDGHRIRSESGGIYYAQCSTSADNNIKVVTANDYTEEEGSVIIISFINGNTAFNPKINVNDSGNKNILYKNSNDIGKKLEKHGLYLFRYANNAYNVVGYLNSDISVFEGEESGLVPDATDLLNKDGFFLQADGTWKKVEIDFDVDRIIERVWDKIKFVPTGYNLLIDSEDKILIDSEGKELLVFDSTT